MELTFPNETMRRVSGQEPVPSAVAAVLERLSSVVGLERFLLFGGAAIDLIRDPKANITDYDVAALNHPEGVRKCKRALIQSGYEITVDERPYRIHRHVEVLLLVGKKGNETVDVSFLGDFKDIGLFDVETLVCRFPEMVYHDPFGALDALKRRTAKLTRRMDDEDPYVVLNRFVHLCAKYGFSMHEAFVHRTLQEDLCRRLSQIADDEYSESRRALTSSHCSMTLRCMATATCRAEFLWDLSRCAWLGATFPELKEYLVSAENRVLLEQATGKSHLVEVLLSTMNSQLLSRFEERLSYFGRRVWDADDQEIASSLELSVSKR